MKIAISVLAVTQLLNLLLVPWFAHAGLALAISLGAWLNSGWLLVGLRRRGLYVAGPGWGGHFARVGVALAAVGTGLWYASRQFDWPALQAQPVERGALVLGLVAGGGIVYFLVLLLLGMRPRSVLRPPRAPAPAGPSTTPAE